MLDWTDRYSRYLQRGAFGACQIAGPHLVADGVRAMVDAVDVPMTVKHRTAPYRLKSDFPSLAFIINGGLKTVAT